MCVVLPPPSEQPPLPEPSEIGLLLSGLPGVPYRLLSTHVSDATGHCAACDLPQVPAPTWPCTLAVYAREANRLQQSRRLPGR